MGSFDGEAPAVSMGWIWLWEGPALSRLWLWAASNNGTSSSVKLEVLVGSGYGQAGIIWWL